MPPRWGWGRAVELMAVLGVVGTTAGWEVQLFRLSNTRRRLHHGGVAYPMRRSRIAPTLKAKQPLELLEVMTDSVANTTVSASEPSLASEARLLAVAGIVGATTGTAVSLLKLSIAATEALSYNEGLRALFQLAGDASNTLVVSTFVYASVPALGGAAVGALRGLPIFDSPTELGAACRALAAVATLGTGNSLGPEGPAVDLGKAVSTSASRIYNDERVSRVIAGAGSAAAVAAGFSAPIAGVFFALEVTFRDDRDPKTMALPRSAVAASALAAAVSALVAQDVMQCRLELVPPRYVASSFPLIELPSYLGLGAFAGFVAIAMRRAIVIAKHIWSDDGALGRHIPRLARPAFGGAVCGTVGVACPPVLFNGYATLNNILADTSPPNAFTLVQYCAVKVATTASSVGCGLVGGLFAPSLFLGATAGGAYGELVSAISKAAASALGAAFAVPAAPAYAAVGSASVLAAMMRAPLSGAMLLFELTRDYDVVLPLIASAGVASVVIEIFEFRREDDSTLAVERPEKDGESILIAATQTEAKDAGDDVLPQ